MLKDLQKQERAKGGVLDMETEVVSSLTAYGAAYIGEGTKELEKVVGLQTDKPLKRAFMPYGGIKMAEQACTTYGYEPSAKLHEIFHNYCKTHNDGVFDAYTAEMKHVRHNHILTGLPDTYGRGRIVGDYRRVALYGIDYLISEKQKDLDEMGDREMVDEVIRLREEVAMQIKALKGLKEMAAIYGFDISKPACNAREAVQWLYFGYLGAVKTQNGAAMSVGRVSTFLDIYIQRDLAEGTLTESGAQELIDHLVMKFRMVKFARIPSYNQLFSGDPVWATLEVGGMGQDGRSMVTKNDYRFLHTLENMGPSPEPNLTVLYSSRLPEPFKRYAAMISVKTSSIQYENDDVMRPVWGDDYSICCCVSATQTGKEMQFFGARANLAKCLTYAISGGVDSKTREQCGRKMRPIEGDVVTYEEFMPRFIDMMDWLAGVYVKTLNLIHYMHDKYFYEAEEMALIDTDVRRTFATGIAGFSHVVDSISAIKYARVNIIRDETGFPLSFRTEGDFPRYGNDDERADEIAVCLLKTFIKLVKKYHTYRNSEPTTSILTITSNVVYGKYTSNMPDGRPAGAPLSPGANPSYGAEKNGLLASLNSVAKLPYEYALDGISNTQTISPDALGHNDEERARTLVSVMDGYFNQGAHHLNVNVFGLDKLKDAMEHPEKEEYQNFTIRVSGYAVKFIDLTREQQLDVIARNAHERL
jgi:formate C-acetyltransferase